MSSELIYQPISQLAEQLASKKVSSVELTQAVIARTQAVDAKVKAFNSYDTADALAQARASDERRAADRTLTDDEVNTAFNKIQDELAKSTPYQIRK